MISIAEMKKLAQKEIKTEKASTKIKQDKELAIWRDRLATARPKLIGQIEKSVYNTIKNNETEVGLHISHFDNYYELLYYLADPKKDTYNNPYYIALKELAKSIREELLNAGIKDIHKNANSRFTGHPYLFLEV